MPAIHIAVVGLGQIGGSIVLSLRKNQAPYHITGIDVSAKRLRLMKPHLDASGTGWKPASDSEIVILCLHYDQTTDFLKHASRSLLISDVCSGKSKLLQLANQRKLRFVGGHPLAGNEFEGEKGWRDDLFADAPYFLTPGKNASSQDVRAIRRFARDLGAKPQRIDAEAHDEFVAVTSHFPAFLSQLIQTSGENVPENFKGPGFESMTRLAKSSPALLKTFLESNAANMIEVAKHFQKQLDQFIFNAKAQGHKE